MEDDLVVLNSAEGRAWPRNVRQNPTVSLVIQNMDNPSEYVQIRGRLAEDTHDGADGHIDKLAKKYLDADSYPYRREGEQRVIFKFRPERVMHWGG